MFTALLAFLPGLLGKLPSLQVAKWIAGAVLLVTIGITGFALGYHWEASAFADYKAAAANHELDLQQKYDAIGGDEAKRYQAAVAADLAETQRQLQELQNAPKAALRNPRHGTRSAPAPDNRGAADDRVIGVLRNAYGGK